MPERWEREIRKLRGVEPREDVIRDRAAQGPSRDRLPPRRNALVAGVVAGAVAIAGVVFLGQLADRGHEIGVGADDLPTLLVTFESSGFIVDQPDEQIQRVETTIVYGDAREENFTSTISESAHVDRIGVDDLTRFVPGPTAGSPVRLQADGENARVLIGTPEDWPEFERFTQIERLPAEPGDYVLLFEATYPDGVARTARFVRIVAPGTMQLAVTTDGWEATTGGFVDGARTEGLLAGQWGEMAGETESVMPAFGPEAVTQMAPGSMVTLATEMTRARGGLFVGGQAGEVEILPRDLTTSVLPWDLTSSDGTLPTSPGRYLLALEIGWNPGDGSLGGSPAALFLFPIEIVGEPREGVGLPNEGVSPTPSPIPSPSSDPVTDGIVVSVYGVGERSDEMPTATFSFAGETETACTQDFEWTLEDGTTLSGIADAGRPDSIPECTRPAIPVPPGTPIALETMSTTRVFTTRATTQFFEGDVGLVVTAEWPEGEATFIVPLTVAFTDPDLELVLLDCRPEDQVPITGPDNRIEPGGSAYIVGNLPGFERSDVVEQMTREQGGESDWAGVWQVVREGSVVASVEYPDLSGEACDGTGIGGA